MSSSSIHHREIPNANVENVSDSDELISSAFDRVNLGDNTRPGPLINPKVFRDGRTARPSDVFIAVMGLTGSGKSSFISLCCQRAAKVGHELRACTTVVDVYAYELSASTTVYLIDTPGFDDTIRSDTEVLREIASWLTLSYSNEVLLSGIIYLHRITDIRMQGSAKKNLLMFKKLCGDDALRKVVLTTTMWDKVPQREAENREQELVEAPEFWGFMVSKGSTVYRHNNTVASAVRIIEELVRGNTTVTLDLQNQMVNQKHNLRDTAAGRELESEMIRERQKWAIELKNAQEQMKEAIRLRDQESEQALQEFKDEITIQMRRLEIDNKRLYIDNERLSNARIERLEKALEEQSKAHVNELKKLQQKDVEVQKASKKIEEISNSVPLVTMSRSTSSYTCQHDKNFFASLNSDEYTLLGPKRSVYNGHFLNELETRRACGDRICYFACGTKYGMNDRALGFVFSTLKANTTGVSFPRSQQEPMAPQHRQSIGNMADYVNLRLIGCSANLKAEYPELRMQLQHESEFLWICLGPNRTFFARLRDTYCYNVPPAITSVIEKFKGNGEITAVALGIDETYVIVYGRKWTWNLKGYYVGLGDDLEWALSTPRFVALNCADESDYLILLDTLRWTWTKEPDHVNLVRTTDFYRWIKDNNIPTHYSI